MHSFFWGEILGSVVVSKAWVESFKLNLYFVGVKYLPCYLHKVNVKIINYFEKDIENIAFKVYILWISINFPNFSGIAVLNFR